ncbi:MAG: alpha/beta hydrolase [Deltaproteobacteria bacterium]|nr:alpha/beta hydrolase [Deltaproteobacteria bacterium]
MTFRFPTRFSIPLLAASLALLPACDSYFFYPQQSFVVNPYLDRVVHEDVFFEAPDGVRLHGWFLRPNDEPRGTVLFLHGNAENISTHVGAVLWLAMEGYQVFLIDYRGYGRSEGTPEMEGIHADALAAIDWLFRTEGVDKDRIVVFGQSLGGAVAVYAVANSPHRDRIRALVIDSAFSGYRRIAREKIAEVVLLWPFQVPLSLLVTDRYSPSRWIGRIRPVPLLILHGEADKVVPGRHGERLYRLAEEPKQLWIGPGAGHIRALSDGNMRKRLLSYLDSVLRGHNSEETEPGER